MTQRFNQRSEGDWHSQKHMHHGHGRISARSNGGRNETKVWHFRLGKSAAKILNMRCKSGVPCPFFLFQALPRVCCALPRGEDAELSHRFYHHFGRAEIRPCRGMWVVPHRSCEARLIARMGSCFLRRCVRNPPSPRARFLRRTIKLVPLPICRKLGRG